MAVGDRVFISYSRKDSKFANSLYTAIEAAGETAWVDWIDIDMGAEWWREIKKGIAAADTFVFIISPDSIASKVCAKEIEYAASQNKRIIPVLYRDPDLEQPIEIIQKINWVFIRETDHLDRNVNLLLSAIKKDLVWVEQHTRILVRANDWVENNRNNSFLLQGDDLKTAERWLGKSQNKEEKPTDIQTEFILASRQIANRNQRRLMSAGSIALILSIALSIWALINGQEAQQNEALAIQNAVSLETKVIEAKNAEATAVSEAHKNKSRELVLQSESIKNKDLSILLASESLNISENPYSHVGLFANIYRGNFYSSIYEDNKLVVDVDFDSTGRLAGVLSCERTYIGAGTMDCVDYEIKIISLDGMKIIAQHIIGERIQDFGFIPNTDELVFILSNGFIGILDSENSIQIEYLGVFARNIGFSEGFVYILSDDYEILEFDTQKFELSNHREVDIDNTLSTKRSNINYFTRESRSKMKVFENVVSVVNCMLLDEFSNCEQSQITTINRTSQEIKHAVLSGEIHNIIIHEGNLIVSGCSLWGNGYDECDEGLIQIYDIDSSDLHLILFEKYTTDVRFTRIISNSQTSEKLIFLVLENGVIEYLKLSGEVDNIKIKKTNFLPDGYSLNNIVWSKVACYIAESRGECISDKIQIFKPYSHIVVSRIEKNQFFSKAKFSQSGKYLAYFYCDPTDNCSRCEILVYDLESNLQKQLILNVSCSGLFRFDESESWIAFLSVENEIEVIDIANNEKIYSYPLSSEVEIVDIIISRDLGALAYSTAALDIIAINIFSSDTIVWDTKVGVVTKPYIYFAGDSSSLLTFSSQVTLGTGIVSYSIRRDGKYIYNFANLQNSMTTVDGIVFSKKAKNNYVIVGATNGEVVAINLETNHTIKISNEAISDIEVVDFSVNGKYILIYGCSQFNGDGDCVERSLSIIESENFTNLETINLSEEFFLDVVFGNNLIIGVTNDGTQKIYSFEKESLLKAGCFIANRTFNEQEIETFSLEYDDLYCK